jgi:hypothetical protein
MAHLVETMAYVNETPWHGLGNQLTEKKPLEVCCVRLAWTGISSLRPCITWVMATCGGILARRCCTGPIPTTRCPWYPTATRLSSLRGAGILSGPG